MKENFYFLENQPNNHIKLIYIFIFEMEKCQTKIEMICSKFYLFNLNELWTVGLFIGQWNLFYLISDVYLILIWVNIFTFIDNDKVYIAMEKISYDIIQKGKKN